jgi:hypothetical protein
MGLDLVRREIKLGIVKSGKYQYQIAREIDVSEISLSKFLRGHGQLSPDKLERLLRLLGLQPSPDSGR